jgi:hypothetical protein
MAKRHSPLAAKIPQNATIVRLGVGVKCGSVGEGVGVLTAKTQRLRREFLAKLSAVAALR